MSIEAHATIVATTTRATAITRQAIAKTPIVRQAIRETQGEPVAETTNGAAADTGDRADG